MAIVANSGTSNRSFEPAPAGVHAAVCVDVVDLGMIESTWQGQTKTQHKIRVAWQIAEERDDGSLFMVFRRYTLSTHPKSSLRKDLESWRGQAFTDAEAREFDVEPIIGQGCLVNVTHNTRGEDTYANVTGVMPLPKGMTAPAPHGYTRVIDRPTEEGAPVEQRPAVVEETPVDASQGASTKPRWRAPRVLNDDDIPA